ncbi:hypothetical protein BTO06_01025 [Tenacibaculum sp. SZ-18]|nr:hypothetical protein BTO06_01025 [Tenacibaculum sp. SZ-18]
MSNMLQHKKSKRHDHFWIDNNFLFESYKTIRGLRFRQVMQLKYPNRDKLSELDVKIINSLMSKQNIN